MRTDTFEPRFVELIPGDIEAGTLYVSMTYATTVHLCACGCGNKVVLPLSPAEWRLTFDGESVSISPSVGNWEYPCRSHYVIRKNRVRWASAWTDEQVRAGRERDQRDLDIYFQQKSAGRADSRLGKLKKRLRKWLIPDE